MLSHSGRRGEGVPDGGMNKAASGRVSGTKVASKIK
jgi:hypothetical protein